MNPDGKLEVLNLVNKQPGWSNSWGSYDTEALKEISSSPDFLYLGV